jgi:hypothetical protein
VDAGEFAVIHMRLRGRGRGSKIESELKVFHVWGFADGKARACRVCWSEAEALEAAGLPRPADGPGGESG